MLNNMSKSNYQILEENKKAALEFAAAIPLAPPVLNINTDSKLQLAKDNLSKGDFSAAIMLLDEIKDNKIGIVWHETNDLGNGTKARVRDARNVSTNPDILKKEQGEKYAMQALNEIRASIELLDKDETVGLKQKEEAKQKLLYLANKALNNTDKLGPENITRYNTNIVASLEKAGISDAAVKLNFAKEITSFHDEHKHIVTLTKVKDSAGIEHSVIEADIMLCGLTPQLKAQYEAIRDSGSPVAEVKVDGVDTGWYNNLPAYKKQLLRSVADKIVSGNYVMPTQLLSTVAGVRNGYDKITAVQSAGQKLVIVNENLHCGTPASNASGADDNQKQQIAAQNVEQLQSFTKNGKVRLNTLNTKILGLKNVNEGYIFQQLENVPRTVANVIFAASPINDWRKVPGGGRDHSSFKKNLKDIGQDLSKIEGLQHVSDFLRKGRGVGSSKEAKALTELLQYPDKQLAKVLMVAIETRKLIDTSVTQEKGNINLSVSNKISIIESSLKNPESSLHKITGTKTKEDFYSRVDFCKSGKDRTGYVQTKNTHEAVADYLDIPRESALMKENLLSQVAGGHTQEMAGIQGGTVGCHGIKQSFVFNLIENDKNVDGVLNQKTADYNSKIKTVSSKKQAGVIRDFETEFSEYKQHQDLKQLKASGVVALSNYEKLQANKQATLEFASKVPTISGSQVISTKQMIEDAKTALAKGDFSFTITKLDQLKDARLGIIWHESEDLGNGTKARVRDARNMTSDTEALKHDSSEKYAMQILNEVRGGLELINKIDLIPEDKQHAAQKLKFVAQRALEYLESNQLSEKEIKEFNTVILDTLEKAGIGQPDIKLNFAKEMVNFKDEHKHIVTLSNAVDSHGKNHTVIEAEIMLNGLTPLQKKQYEMIAASRPGDKFGTSDMAWYDDMPVYRRDMLREVAADIAAGNKVIPTQLLGNLIGIKNAYQKVTAVQADDKTQILSETLHCGTPATKIKIHERLDLSKKQNKQLLKAHQASIVEENVRQLQSFTEAGKRINLNNLTSSTPVDIRGEGFIFDQLNAVKSERIAVSASPINKWRALGGGREQREFDKTLKNIGTDFANKPEFKNLATFLQKNDLGNQTNKYLKLAKNEIANLENSNPKLAGILKAAVDVKTLIREYTNLSKSENINLEISAKMNLIDNAIVQKDGALHNLISQTTKEQQAIRIDFCKSGKDRTGLVQTKNSHTVVSNHLGVDPESPLGKQNLLKQVSAGHTQELAGVQGGTTGCHSIKTNPEFAINKSDKVIDGIINQNSSHYNSSIKAVVSKKKPEVLARFEADYQADKAKDNSKITTPKKVTINAPIMEKEELGLPNKYSKQLLDDISKIRKNVITIGKHRTPNTLNKRTKSSSPSVPGGPSGF